MDFSDDDIYLIYYRDGDIYLAFYELGSFEYSVSSSSLSDGYFAVNVRLRYWELYKLDTSLNDWAFIDANGTYDFRYSTHYYSFDYSQLVVNNSILPSKVDAYLLFSSVDIKDSDGNVVIKGNDVLSSNSFQESVIYPVITRDSMTEPILNELSGVFLLCLSSIIFYLAIRKAIDFILSFLRGA